MTWVEEGSVPKAGKLRLKPCPDGACGIGVKSTARNGGATGDVKDEHWVQTLGRSLAETNWLLWQANV
jgi:hypothetical protein